MDKYILKRGNSTIQLEKSDTLIGLKASQDKNLEKVVKNISKENSITDSGLGLGGFQIMSLDTNKDILESTLNELRKNEFVDVGTHVYFTPDSDVPFVPTGKITIRFKPNISLETQNEIFDFYKLQILNSKVKLSADGTKKETYIAGVTQNSDNPLSVAARLQEREDIIELAEPDLATPGKLKGFTLPSDNLLKEQWHLENTGVQFGTSGGLKQGADARVIESWKLMQSLGDESCVIAVIDDGFDLSHPDFNVTDKIVSPWDFETNNYDPTPKHFHPQNGDWHGTACAGVALAAANGNGGVGAAPNCRFMPVRWGSELTDDSIEDWFSYVAIHGASVVSCSWGALAKNYTLSTRQYEAIQECATRGRSGLGCVIVFAAGNDNHNINNPSAGTIDGFAIHPNVICVAASTSRDQKADYSNYGKEVTVCAPSSGAGGRGILTTDVRGQYKIGALNFYSGYDKDDYTKSFGGTSSAAPLVAGICALMLSVNPELNAAEIKSILQTTARKIGNGSYDNSGHSLQYGYGCINAFEAVNFVRNQTSSKPKLLWGFERHKLIGKLADSLLTDKAKKEIERIMSKIDETLLENVATWADDLKYSPGTLKDQDSLDFLSEYPNPRVHGSWHFVNIPTQASGYDRTKYPAFTKDDDVVQITSECIRVLQKKSSKFTELNALRWLTHLAGDIHQPVHVGCSFIFQNNGKVSLEFDPDFIIKNKIEKEHDEGGNKLLLPINGFKKKLHSFWDTDLPNLDTIDTLNFPVQSPTKYEDLDKLPVLWASETINEAKIAYQSLTITEKVMVGGREAFKLSWDSQKKYIDRCLPIVKKQKELAASRLAFVLNSIFY